MTLLSFTGEFVRIDSPDNKRFKHLLKLKQDSKYRQEAQKILLEGRNLIQDLPDNVKGILYSTEEELIPGWETIQISGSLAKKLSDTLHPENRFAEVAMPKEAALLPSPLIAFDAVSDPGNLGTLLRTAAAFGWGGALFLPGCCDPFNPKVIRASKGALFTLPFRKLSFSDLEELSQKQKLEILTGDILGERPETVQRNQIVLILGNEGQGLSEESKKLGKPIAIPMPGKMESLNVAVAGGILMYLLKGSP